MHKLPKIDIHVLTKSGIFNYSYDTLISICCVTVCFVHYQKGKIISEKALQSFRAFSKYTFTQEMEVFLFHPTFS